MGLDKYVFTAGLALAAALLCGSGCQTQPEDTGWAQVTPTGGAGDVTLYQDIQFEDIPVPDGYALITSESHSFLSSTFRSGAFLYEGRLDWPDALAFYRTALPAAGWTLEKTERGFDFRIMYFRKGQEQLLATVRQLRGGSRTELQLDNIDRNDLLLKGRLPSSQRM